MLSKKAKYGIRALLYLAARRGKGPVQIKDIASDEGIPRKFLEAILVELKATGILWSRAGKGGGYELQKPPAEVDLGQIVRQIDGPLAWTPCVSQTAYEPCDDCPSEQECLIRLVMKRVRDETAEILENTSLEDMLEEGRKIKSAEGPIDFVI